MVVWITLDIIHAKYRKMNVSFVSIPGLCSATVVGLVVVTPGAGFVQPGYALLMGAIGGLSIHLFLSGKKHFFHVDDTLDVFSCHGMGGFIGTILTALFSQVDVNKNGRNGALYGNPMLLAYHLLAAVVTIAFSAITTAAILLPMHFTVGIRINRQDQVRGLDNVAHGIIDVEETQKAQQQIKSKSTKRTSNEPQNGTLTAVDVQ